LSGWISVCNEWLDHLDHVPGSFVELDEHAVVQLSQSEELQDLLWLWSKLVDTKRKKGCQFLRFLKHYKKGY
jgi:hypothetical protein